MIIASHIQKKSYSSRLQVASGESKKGAKKTMVKQYTAKEKTKESAENSEIGFCNINSKKVQSNSPCHFGRENARLLIYTKIFHLTTQQTSTIEIQKC